MLTSEHPEFTRARELRAEAQRCWERWQQVKTEAVLLNQEATRLIAQWQRLKAASRAPRWGWIAPAAGARPPAPADSVASAPPRKVPPAYLPPFAPSARPLPLPAPAAAAGAGSPASLASSTALGPPAPEPMAPEAVALLAATAAVTAATTAASEMLVSFLAIAASDFEPTALSMNAALSLMRPSLSGGEEDHARLLAKARAALQAAAGEPAPTGGRFD